jgi:hypothetical protein
MARYCMATLVHNFGVLKGEGSGAVWERAGPFAGTQDTIPAIHFARAVVAFLPMLDNASDDEISSVSSAHEQEESLNEIPMSRRNVSFSDDRNEEISPSVVVSDVETGGISGDDDKIVQCGNRRTSCVTDLETGREGGARGQMAQVSSRAAITLTDNALVIPTNCAHFCGLSSCRDSFEPPTRWPSPLAHGNERRFWIA